MNDLVNELTRQLAAAQQALHKVQGKLDAATRSLEARSQELAQTRAAVTLLLATLDATPDGVLAIGQYGRAVHCNESFAAMWRIPPDKLPTLNEPALLALQLVLVQDPEGFLAEVEQRRARPDEAHACEVPLVDGRVLEWHMRPHRVHGRRLGTVSCYREKKPSHTSFTPVRNMPA